MKKERKDAEERREEERKKGGITGRETDDDGDLDRGEAVEGGSEGSGWAMVASNVELYACYSGGRRGLCVRWTDSEDPRIGA